MQESDEITEVDDSNWVLEIDVDVAYESVEQSGVEHRLSWDGSTTNLPGKACYDGSSRRSKFRKVAAEKELHAATESLVTPITSFFAKVPAPVPAAAAPSKPIKPNSYDDSNPNSVLSAKDCEEAISRSIAQCLDDLDASNVASVSPNVKYAKLNSNYDHIRYLAIQRYFFQRNQGDGKMVASEKACLVMAPVNRPYLATCIRHWADHYQAMGTLPVHQQGKHVKVESLISHEDVKLACLATIRGLKRNERTAEKFQ